jgi:hypothetical protein
MGSRGKKRLPDSDSEQVPTDSAEISAVRRCESCLLEYPLQQFRRRRKDQELRMRECRQCHNRREQLRRSALCVRASRRQMAKAMTRLKNGTAAARVPVFCAEMVEHFGGAEGFLNAWKACIGRDLERGGLPAFRHIAVLLRFMEASQPQPVDYSTMSDEELLERAYRLGVPH